MLWITYGDVKHSEALQFHSHRVGTQYQFKTEKPPNVIQALLEYYSGTPEIKYKYNCSSLETPLSSFLQHNTNPSNREKQNAAKTHNTQTAFNNLILIPRSTTSYYISYSPIFTQSTTSSIAVTPSQPSPQERNTQSFLATTESQGHHTTSRLCPLWSTPLLGPYQDTRRKDTKSSSNSYQKRVQNLIYTNTTTHVKMCRVRRIVYSCGHPVPDAAYIHDSEGWEIHPNHLCPTRRGGQLCSESSLDYSHAENPRKPKSACPTCEAAA
jgi:hypothetical protein